jgi:hypothetical protein
MQDTSAKKNTKETDCSQSFAEPGVLQNEESPVTSLCHYRKSGPPKIRPRRRNLWVIDTFERRPEAHVAQTTVNAMPSGGDLDLDRNE